MPRAIGRGIHPALAVFPESSWAADAHRMGLCRSEDVLVADSLLPASAGSNHRRPWLRARAPCAPELDPLAASVILDRVQDAGNVVAILRTPRLRLSAVIALKGTAALWSPKCLRAGMGAHFGLRLLESIEPPHSMHWPCRS